MDHQIAGRGTDLVKTLIGEWFLVADQSFLHLFEFDLIGLHDAKIVLDQLVDEIVEEAADRRLQPLFVGSDVVDLGLDEVFIIDEDDLFIEKHEAEAMIVDIDVTAIRHTERSA